MKFTELYNQMVKSSLDGSLEEDANIALSRGADPGHLDCLLNPEKHPPVWRLKQCICNPGGKSSCMEACIFGAITRDEKGNVSIDPEKCVGCEECLRRCKEHNLTASRDILPALAAVRSGEAPVYALIAPAFVSQFDIEVTPGRLRSAFKRLGFQGMVEVAAFADILTLKEALEFDKSINKEQDFQLTSCCCPIWIGILRKSYHRLMPHVPGSVSPMIACGRTVKRLHPNAKTVFIGPCLAKKAEAREPDLKGAVDFVLTFQEMQQIFDFAGIEPGILPEEERDHSSKAGRIYARAGGVSRAVSDTVKRLRPDRKIQVHPMKADGVPALKKMMEELERGETHANFFEGMGCVGGCVGGPKALISRETGREHVDVYGESAPFETPLDNPYVLELLKRLGFSTTQALLNESRLFTRYFDNK